MRYFLILFFVFSNQLSSLDITHYYNEFVNVSGVYDSPEHGLIISNSTGLYYLDKETGETSVIKYTGSNESIEFKYFFEFESEVYCYRQGKLFRIRDGKLDSIANSVTAHYVFDNKLYLIKNKEPNVEIIEGDQRQTFHTGETYYYTYGNFIEIEGTVYGLMKVNKSSYLFKIGKDSLEYIINPEHSQHSNFNFIEASKIYNVNNELWFMTLYGLYKFVDGSYVEVGSQFEFEQHQLFEIICEDNEIFGINEKGIFKADLTTKETKYLVIDSVNEDQDIIIKKINGSIFFQIDREIYHYNIPDSEFKNKQLENTGNILAFTEDLNENLFIARDDFLELHQDNQTKVFRKTEGVVTNKFLDVTYDKFNDRIIFIGLYNSQWIVQTYKDGKWDYIETPWYSGTQTPPSRGINIKADLNGNYYYANKKTLGFWDGTKWERLVMSKTPEDSIYPNMQSYYVLLTDSLGGVWVNAQLSEFSPETGKIEKSKILYRFKDGEYEIIEDYSDNNDIDKYVTGICLKNGKIYLNTEMFWDTEMCVFIDGVGTIFEPEDSDTTGSANDNRNLCENANGDLVVAYNESTTMYPPDIIIVNEGGLSSFDGENWDHNFYNDIAKQNDLKMSGQKVIYDEYGNDFIISKKMFIGIGKDQKTQVFPSDDLSQSIAAYQLLQIDNELWITSSDNGVYNVKLPFLTSVPDQQKSQEKILKNEIVNNNTLELLIDIKNYQIFTIVGKRVGSGLSRSNIDVSNLSTGVYIIVCNTNKKTVVQKFVKLP